MNSGHREIDSGVPEINSGQVEMDSALQIPGSLLLIPGSVPSIPDSGAQVPDSGVHGSVRRVVPLGSALLRSAGLLRDLLRPGEIREQCFDPFVDGDICPSDDHMIRRHDRRPSAVRDATPDKKVLDG